MIFLSLQQSSASINQQKSLAVSLEMISCQASVMKTCCFELLIDNILCQYSIHWNFKSNRSNPC